MRSGSPRHEPAEAQVLAGHGGPALPSLVGPGGRAWAVVWPGVGAQLRSMHRIALDAGGETRLLRHPGEAVYYVIRGEGIVEEPEAGSANDLGEGSMVHVEPETPYLMRAGAGTLELIGGPSPADPRLYEDQRG